jgi:hypothetical protein
MKALEAAEKRAQASRVLGSGGRLGGTGRVAGLSPRELAARVRISFWLCYNLNPSNDFNRPRNGEFATIKPVHLELTHSVKPIELPNRVSRARSSI